jgi:hypothetical protein
LGFFAAYLIRLENIPVTLLLLPAALEFQLEVFCSLKWRTEASKPASRQDESARPNTNRVVFAVRSELSRVPNGLFEAQKHRLTHPSSNRLPEIPLFFALDHVS